jgi:hypothetical protein
MLRKCKCDCEMKLYIQNMQHQEQMERVTDAFIRLRRDMAWFKYSITNDRRELDKLEFELKVGGF